MAIRRTGRFAIGLWIVAGLLLLVWEAVWPAMALAVLGVWLAAGPRKKMPWRLGWFRWLFGDYRCDICGEREGFGPWRDLRSGTNLNVRLVLVHQDGISFSHGGHVHKVSPSSTGHQRYTEIRICGVPHRHSVKNHRMQAVEALCLKQTGRRNGFTVVHAWFTSAAKTMERQGALPKVSEAVAFRTIAKLAGVDENAARAVIYLWSDNPN